MPTKYQDPTAVLDEKLKLITTGANEMRLLSGYTAGDTYATVNTNTLGSVAIAAVDWTFAAHGTNGRKVTLALKTANATATAAAGDRHIALVDTVGSRVLHVTDETTDQAVTSGNPIDYPAIEIRENQPV